MLSIQIMKNAKIVHSANGMPANLFRSTLKKSSSQKTTRATMMTVMPLSTASGRIHGLAVQTTDGEPELLGELLDMSKTQLSS